MDWYGIIAQALGIAGAVFAIGAYQFKNVKTTYLMQAIGAILFTANFIMLGAWMGAVMNFIALIRSFLFMSKKPWTTHWITVSLICAACAAVTVFWGGITPETWYGVLPAVGISVGAILMYTRSARILRVGQLTIISPSWLIYDTCVFTIGGIITESFIIVSIFVSFIRFGWKGLAKDE